MKSTRKILSGTIVAAALAASSMFVHAQPQGPGPGWRDGPQGGPGMMMHGGPGPHSMGPGAGGGHRGMGSGTWQNPAAMVEGHLAALKVELKITPEQESAWQAFATKSRQQAATMLARRTEMVKQHHAAPLAAPDRLAQRAAFMKEAAANMETMAGAVKDLYAVLSPEQKALADMHLAQGPMRGQRGRMHGR